MAVKEWLVSGFDDDYDGDGDGDCRSWLSADDDDDHTGLRNDNL